MNDVRPSSKRLVYNIKSGENSIEATKHMDRSLHISLLHCKYIL